MAPTDAGAMGLYLPLQSQPLSGGEGNPFADSLGAVGLSVLTLCNSLK